MIIYTYPGVFAPAAAETAYLASAARRGHKPCRRAKKAKIFLAFVGSVCYYI